MSKWLARLKAEISQTPHQPTAKTDEMGVLAVSSVPAGAVYQLRNVVSSVSSVGVVALFENRILAADLMDAAMVACENHGDSDAKRSQMRADVLATPEHLHADLLDHFNKTYPKRANHD